MNTSEMEQGIRQLLARSSDCVWRKDADNYALCWATDGVWRILGTEAVGRDLIKAAWQGHMDALTGAWQAAQSVTFAFDGDVAQSRLYLEESLYMKTGGIVLTRGVYHDRYKIEDGQWVFAKRVFDLVYLGPADMSGRTFKTIDYGPAPYDPDPNRAATPTFEEAYG